MKQLNGEQLSQFYDEDYLVIRDFFDPEADLDSIIAEYDSVLDRLVF